MMKPTRMLCVAVLGVTILAAHSAAQAPAALNDAVRRTAIEKAADLLRTAYIFPEAGEAAAKKIEGELAAGSYETLSDRLAFAQKVTADLQSVTHDKHIRVFPGAPGAPAAIPPVNSEFGVVRADRLDGGIGYIEISGFPALERFSLAVDPAMAAGRAGEAGPET